MPRVRDDPSYEYALLEKYAVRDYISHDCYIDVVQENDRTVACVYRLWYRYNVKPMDLYARTLWSEERIKNLLISLTEIIHQ